VKRHIAAAALAVLVLAWSAPPAGGAEPGYAGHWEGAVELPGAELGIRVDLERGPDGWKGTIDIPVQSAIGLPLTAVHVDGAAIGFAIAGVPGAPTFDGTLKDDGTIRGPFSQSGQTFSFRLRRDERAPLPARPQDPKPPFPYRTEDITFASGDITLAGTVAVPEGAGPFPGAVLITGSGAQNRDEELLRAVESDALADQVRNAMEALVVFQEGRVAGAKHSGAETLAGTVDRELARITTPWFRYALTLDPRIALRRVTVPALVLDGSRDLQVSPAQNVPEIVTALLEGGNSDVTVRVLPGLNHLFQPATTGAVSEYATIDTTIAPEVLDLITSWIREHF